MEHKERDSEFRKLFPDLPFYTPSEYMEVYKKYSVPSPERRGPTLRPYTSFEVSGTYFATGMTWGTSNSSDNVGGWRVTTSNSN